MVHRVFNSAQYLLVNVHHVVNGGQYVNQMARSVDYSAYLVNTALESMDLFNLCNSRYWFVGCFESSTRLNAFSPKNELREDAPTLDLC